MFGVIITGKPSWAFPGHNSVVGTGYLAPLPRWPGRPHCVALPFPVMIAVVSVRSEDHSASWSRIINEEQKSRGPAGFELAGYEPSQQSGWRQLELLVKA